MYKLRIIISKYKKYEVVVEKVVELRKNKNSKQFIKQKLIEEGLEEAVINDIVEELFEIVT